MPEDYEEEDYQPEEIKKWAADVVAEQVNLKEKINFANTMAKDFANTMAKGFELHVDYAANASIAFGDPFGVAAAAPEVMAEEVVEDEEGADYGFKANRQQEMLVWYPRNASGDGYADNTCALDPIYHYNIQDLLARFFITTHANWGVVKNWRANVIGITSYYFGAAAATKPGGAHMPMFDYDGKNIKKIIRQDVKLLQKEYGLGDAWVYETRRGFHVYFFTDVVARDEFYEMLEKVNCCRGYKQSIRNKGYAVLRVSAKYTDYDIKSLYILDAAKKKLKRMSRKAHTIRALIDLGQECGTHIASMYPQWAHFKQDAKEWKGSAKKPMAKRIKKAPKMKQASTGLFNPEPQGNYIVSNTWASTTTTTTTTSATGPDGWYK
jgi:hypothetical protein